MDPDPSDSFDTVVVLFLNSGCGSSASCFFSFFFFKGIFDFEFKEAGQESAHDHGTAAPR